MTVSIPYEPGRAAFASSSRRHTMGCAQARLLPLMKTVSAWATSS
mgnify:CR=1 FL=1